MELTKTFETPFAPDIVWSGLSNVRLVAGCLPGASIVEEIGPDEYRGKLQIKVGPLAASFAGLISIERVLDEKTAIVTGKGADAKSSSRVTAKMTYQVKAGASDGSQVEIRSDISLAGALAQFGKATVMQEIANRMTDEFIRRFEAQLSQSQAEHGALATAAWVEVAASVEVGESKDGVERDRINAAAPNAILTPVARKPATEAVPFDAGNMLWSIFKEKVAAFFRKLFK